MAWYIDSWSVLDGLAFASQRAADSLDAGATVFLSVPDLEPIPVGRISTALRAQRASFQDGFRDMEGNEIPFDSLDQIREVVRRAYLGGGLGPAPVAIDAPPIDPLLREPERPPAEPPPRNGGGFLEMELERLGREPHVFIDYAPLQGVCQEVLVFENYFPSRPPIIRSGSGPCSAGWATRSPPAWSSATPLLRQPCRPAPGDAERRGDPDRAGERDPRARAAPRRLPAPAGAAQARRRRLLCAAPRAAAAARRVPLPGAHPPRRRGR